MKPELNDVNKDAIAFARMSDEQFSQVFEDLRKLPLALATPDRVFELIRGHGLLEEQESTSGSFILLAIYQLADKGSKDIAKLIDGFIDAVRPELQGQVNERPLLELLRFRLEKVSQLEDVITSVKASLLVAERDKVLLSTRLITDIRPVLGGTFANPAMLIINTLKLEYREGSEIRTSYIALDRQDIANLIAQLERAQRKDELIVVTLKAAQSKIIE